MKNLRNKSCKTILSLAAYGAYSLFVVLFLLLTADFALQVIQFIDHDLSQRFASAMSLLEYFGF